MFVINKECRAGIAEHLREDNVIDAVVTDPPYGLSKEPDTAEVLRHWLNGDDYKQTGRGFMGKTWDSFVPGPATWREVYRVLKPGGHALVFAGSRTQDLMAMALRLAGFEIRDTAMWLYGSGFPKSLDVSTAVATREEHLDTTPEAIAAAKQWEGWGTALKPAYEPIIIARKPLVGTVADNVLQYGTGAINIDGCRIPGKKPDTTRGAGGQHGRYSNIGAQGRIEDDGRGRWPANILHDGSDEVVGLFPSNAGAAAPVTRRGSDKFRSTYGAFSGNRDEEGSTSHNDPGSAARFFYCAKASKADRNAGLDAFDILSAGDATGGRDEGSAGLNNPRAGTGRTGGNRNPHPTVKPTELMRYLCRLVTPPGGLIMDPFTGSGSTGRGAVLEGFNFLGFQWDPDDPGGRMVDIANARILDALTVRTLSDKVNGTT